MTDRPVASDMTVGMVRDMLAGLPDDWPVVGLEFNDPTRRGNSVHVITKVEVDSELECVFVCTGNWFPHLEQYN